MDPAGSDGPVGGRVQELINIKIDPEFLDLIQPSKSETNGIPKGPVEVWNGWVVDGIDAFDCMVKNRLTLEYKKIELPSRKAAMVYIIEKQMARLDLVQYWKIRMVLKRYQLDGTIIPKSERSGRHRRADYRLAEMAGVTHDAIYRVQEIEKRLDPSIRKRIALGDDTVNQHYRALRPKRKHGSPRLPRVQTERKNSRINEIQSLTGNGYNVDQIAEEIGITVERVRLLARQGRFKLHDSMFMNYRDKDAEKIVVGAVSSAIAISNGIEFLNGNLLKLDTSKIPAWLEELERGSRAIRQLTILLKGRSNDKSDK